MTVWASGVLGVAAEDPASEVGPWGADGSCLRGKLRQLGEACECSEVLAFEMLL